MYTLHDYVYLTERLYINDIQNQNNENNVSSEDDSPTADVEDVSIVISKDEERCMYRHNLDKCLSLFCLNNGCWHTNLEKEFGNPFSTTQPMPNGRIDNCNANCPHCDGTMDEFIKPIVRTGLMCVFS